MSIPQGQLLFCRARYRLGCRACGVLLAEHARLHATGHRWDSQPATVYHLHLDEPNPLLDLIAEAAAVEVDVAQGRVTVARTTCSGCGASLGWRFLASPTLSETGAFGFKQLAVSETESCDAGVGIPAPAADNPAGAIVAAFMARWGVPGLAFAVGSAAAGVEHAMCFGFATMPGDGAGAPSLVGDCLLYSAFSTFNLEHPCSVARCYFARPGVAVSPGC